MSQQNVQPPRWATRLLEWYCKPELLEDLQGDLHEYFARNCKSGSPRKARLIYVIDVLKFFRSYTIRKPSFINYLIHWVMIGSYVKTSGRSIMRNKLFSGINIIGLAISMSVGLVTIAMLWDVYRYDRFHENSSRIYRIIAQYQYLNRKDNDWMATTSMKVGKEVKESIAGPEAVAVLHRDFSGDMTYGTRTVPVSGLQANDDFFKVFSFNLVSGNPASALKEPFSVVLTETTAKKIFGAESPMGKTIKYNGDRDYTVTGIIQDPPKLTHMKFEALGSLSSRLVTQKDNPREYRWDNMWNTWVYVLMPENADLKNFQASLDELCNREDPTVEHTNIDLALQPLTGIMSGEDLGNQIGPVVGNIPVMIFIALTFVIILSACFNYTNLSIARALNRAREVGIRKTIGALKSHVIMQFIVESIILSLIALAFSFVIFLVVKPHFMSLENSLQQTLLLELSAPVVILFLFFAMFIGAAAGFFPALFFSRINAVQVLKSISSVKLFKGVTLRKVLIVFQYSLSIIFITVTIVIYKQYQHFIAYDLGFTTDNIINIRLYNNKPQVLKNELSQLAEVKDMSTSAMVMSVGNYWGTTMRNPNDPADSAGVFFNMIDHNYIPMHDLKIIAGSNFKALGDSARESEIIVTKGVLKRFNIAGQDINKAIGQVVRLDRKELQIVGVVDDFEYGRANNRTNQEVLFRQMVEQPEYLNVKINSTDWPATYAKIETIWKKVDDVHPLEARFYKEELEEAFQGLKAAAKVGGFLAFLVVCISSVGLLGMVVFTTETRLKEISIRKVLGASEGGLLYLLGKSFVMLLGIAAAIGVPITWIFFEKLMFPEIANHAPLEFFELFAGVIGVLLIALLMIGLQTLKVARTNPAEVLKAE